MSQWSCLEQGSLMFISLFVKLNLPKHIFASGRCSNSVNILVALFQYLFLLYNLIFHPLWLFVFSTLYSFLVFSLSVSLQPSLHCKIQAGFFNNTFFPFCLDSGQTHSPLSHSSISPCSEVRVTQFIKKYVASCLLISDTNTELSYILPSDAVKKGCFERLFQVPSIWWAQAVRKHDGGEAWKGIVPWAGIWSELVAYFLLKGLGRCNMSRSGEENCCFARGVGVGNSKSGKTWNICNIYFIINPKFTLLL